MKSPGKGLDELTKRPESEVVIARAGSRYRWLEVAETYAFVAICIAVLAFFIASFAHLCALAYMNTTPDETNMKPPVWLFQAARWTFLGAFAFGSIGGGIAYATNSSRAMEKWFARPDIVTIREIRIAPTQLAKPLLHAVTAAETIRNSAAIQNGWLTGIELDAVLWNLAEQFKAGVALNAEMCTASDLADGKSLPDYKQQIDAAEAAVLACSERLSEGAQRLAEVADRVKSFDRALSEPARQAKLAALRERRERRDRDQIARLSTARTALESIEPEVDNVVDIADGQLDAYEELPKVERS